jgi:hypothetical protein
VNACEGVEAKLHAILTVTLDRSERSASGFGRFTQILTFSSRLIEAFSEFQNQLRLFGENKFLRLPEIEINTE